VRGYHVYQRIWDAPVGEELPAAREPRNSHDTFAVAIKKDGITVGHVPKTISEVCSIFSQRRGVIFSRVTGHRRYSADLDKGGLEIPCTLILYSNDVQLLDVTRNLLVKASSVLNDPKVSYSNCTNLFTVLPTIQIISQLSQMTSQSTTQPSQIIALQVTTQPSQIIAS